MDGFPAEKTRRPNYTEYLVFAVIFIIALIPRVIGLGKTIVADEQLWIIRSMDFAKALFALDPAGTAISSHPGVVTMWLGALFIGAAKLLFGYKHTVDLLFAAQLPIALFTAFTVVLFYTFSKKAFNGRIALFATIFFGLDVFYLAYSRIIHLDAVLSGLMVLSFLAMLVFYNNSTQKKWLYISGFLGGLSVLAKVSGVFMVPMVVLVSFVFFVRQSTTVSRGQISPLIKNHVVHTGIWIGVALLTTFIFWPAMWVHPGELVDLFLRGPGMVAHEHGAYVLGESVEDPGAVFYLLILLFRTTPLLLIFLIAGVIVLLSRTFQKKEKIGTIEVRIWLCAAYVFFFFIMMSIPDKKIGRYILPVFPILALMAGAGIYYCLEIIRSLLPSGKIGRISVIAAASILIIVQLYNIASVFPYYLSYYNPIPGGPQAAVKAILVGRGEGLDLVAEYLNQKADAESLTVASEFGYLLQVHFKGKVMTTHIDSYEPDTLEKSDYLVVYLSGLQRQELRIPREVLNYHDRHQPEKIITINGIYYAYIYYLQSDNSF